MRSLKKFYNVYEERFVTETRSPVVTRPRATNDTIARRLQGDYSFGADEHHLPKLNLGNGPSHQPRWESSGYDGSSGSDHEGQSDSGNEEARTGQPRKSWSNQKPWSTCFLIDNDIELGATSRALWEASKYGEAKQNAKEDSPAIPQVPTHPRQKRTRQQVSVTEKILISTKSMKAKGRKIELDLSNDGSASSSSPRKGPRETLQRAKRESAQQRINYPIGMTSATTLQHANTTQDGGGSSNGTRAIPGTNAAGSTRTRGSRDAGTDKSPSMISKSSYSQSKETNEDDVVEARIVDRSSNSDLPTGASIATVGSDFRKKLYGLLLAILSHLLIGCYSPITRYLQLRSHLGGTAILLFTLIISLFMSIASETFRKCRKTTSERRRKNTVTRTKSRRQFQRIDTDAGDGKAVAFGSDTPVIIGSSPAVGFVGVNGKRTFSTTDHAQ